VIDAKDLSRFRHIDATAITPNHLEAQLAVRGSTSARAGKGCTLNGDGGLEELRAVGYELLEIIDCEIVAITLAADGVLLLNRNGGSTHLPAHPVTHANVAGAGDSFTAAFALGLAARTHPLEAARIALAAAGIAVAKRRTAVVHLQELLQRVSLESPAPEGRHEALPLLAARLEAERRRGRSIVFTNGVFDILHAGHVDFLRRARQLGDILVVGVNSDRSARRLKGKNRPINSERDRAALVAALDPVDYVITFDETTPSETIRALRPDIHAKGGDYAGETLPEEEAVREAGGRVVILPLLGDVSTSGVIERIAAVSQPPVGARR
jgi:D-beta-D-heptose 7-phosphate kinase/D-beta-D-heptose 1-phosphate adenosyltransferase